MAFKASLTKWGRAVYSLERGRPVPEEMKEQAEQVTTAKGDGLMDLYQIEYMVKLAQEKNITKAAEKLYISQSALNQQLLNLERELGVQLFRRNRNDWSLTEAGKIYLDGALRILEIKKEAYARISDIAQVKREELVLGVTPGKGGQMVAWIYKQFYKKYPHIKLTVRQSMGPKLRREIGQGVIDIGILTVGDMENLKEDCELLLKEEWLIVMSKNHPMTREAVQEEDGTWVQDLSKFKNEKFVLGTPGINSQILDRVFEEAGFVPYKYAEAGEYNLRLSMVEMNLCVTMVEEHHRDALSGELASFKLKSHPEFYVVAAYKKRKYLSKAARAFIELAREYWQNYTI